MFTALNAATTPKSRGCLGRSSRETPAQIGGRDAIVVQLGVGGNYDRERRAGGPAVEERREYERAGVDEARRDRGAGRAIRVDQYEVEHHRQGRGDQAVDHRVAGATA